LLVSPDDDVDVHALEHAGSIPPPPSTGALGGNSSSSSSSSSDGAFVAVVDSDDAPDGQVVLIWPRALQTGSGSIHSSGSSSSRSSGSSRSGSGSSTSSVSSHHLPSNMVRACT
jgi:hypothetical protein